MKKLLALGVLLAALLTTPVQAKPVHGANTLTIVEPAPYYMGQTIHIVTSTLHGREEQRVWCTQNGLYVYSESNMGSEHSYVLDTPNVSMIWNHSIPANCEAFIWNGFNPNTRNPIVPFTVLP